MSRIDPIARAQQMRDAGTEPQTPYPGADKRWPGICHRAGHITLSSYTSVITRKQGPCFICGQIASSRAAAAKRRVKPETAVANIRKADVEPLGPFPGTQEKWRCRCNRCGGEIDVWYSSVVYNGNCACTHCSGTAPLAPAAARAEMLAFGLEPLIPYPSANEKWRSRCLTCRLIVDPSLTNARKTKSKCRYCAKRATDPETARKIMEAAGLEPIAPFPGGVKAPWRARHITCGKEVSPTLDKVIQKRRAPCIHCAQHGFQPGRPGYVYVVVNPALAAAKIGICNEGTDRLRSHERNGWLLVEQVLLDGHLAAKAEDLVLERWTQLDLPYGATSDDMPQGGWTETVALVDRTISDVLNDYKWAVETCC
ncbi:hypothetical protein ACFXAF_12020 [Kitasatospora sp. NPDC059463]|uniref:hypothetical protein n=1 Tax=unclassified Kitasatospora TaxID=2633591 RepID=UPI0036CE6283